MGARPAHLHWETMRLCWTTGILATALLFYLLPPPTSAQIGRAKAVIQSWNIRNWTRLGTILMEEFPGEGWVRVSGTLHGLTPGQHGFHIHRLGDLEDGCLGAEGHYNPAGVDHGAPTASTRHAGDLGNILADQLGTARVDMTDRGFSLYGPDSVIGRAFIVHAGRDDLGLGGNDDSLKSGNAGARVACGIIGIASNSFSANSLPQVARDAVNRNCMDTEAKRDPATGENYCLTWQRQGYCDSPADSGYRNYMNQYCRRTCGRC